MILKWSFNAASSLEIQRYYQSEPKFNGVYLRDNLPDKVKRWGIYNKSG